jgi:hypothetical protein
MHALDPINMNDVLRRGVRLPDYRHTFYVYIEQDQEDDVTADEIIEKMAGLWSKNQILSFLNELLIECCDTELNKAALAITRNLLRSTDIEEVNLHAPPLSFEEEL